MYFAEIMVPCFESGGNCRMDWAAVAAVGGWAAALGTVVAVALPYWRARREESAVTRMVLSDVIPDLLAIKRDLETALTLVSMIKEGHAAPDEGFGAHISLYTELPNLKVIPERSRTIRALTELRTQIREWNRCCELFDSEKLILSASLVTNLAPMLEKSATGVLVKTARLAHEILRVLPKDGERLQPLIARGRVLESTEYGKEHAT